nr:immunoglobulin light chain junction region [Macaca mulatta]MOX69294.1 immunoglobulin light chain junction region [Macaca mulatta]MOX69330.1 immunoglobulin light chain junction region [Macaca mulatta]MOX69390.1 immunoglobulin light chain junction region [Macaca mulatta]MOX69419.1 immunoglobulin light chain junction region [Macaca mulatta]
DYYCMLYMGSGISLF